MSALIIMSFSMCTMLIFPLMAQPLSLGLSIMVSTCAMCCLLGVMLSAWYGYILFLIYVGGLLVMFAYVAALSPNILFGGGGVLGSMGIIFLLGVVVLYSYPFIDSTLMTNYSSFSHMGFMKVYGGEFVCPDSISILVGLAVILLINLVAVVKVCRYQKASLRPFSESL